MSCPQIWNKEKEKDRKKEEIGDRPVNLREKKGGRRRARARENLKTLLSKICVSESFRVYHGRLSDGSVTVLVLFSR